MDRWSGRIAVVTGAAGGIGAAVTKKLLQYDIVVVGLSFTEEKLEVSKLLQLIIIIPKSNLP